MGSRIMCIHSMFKRYACDVIYVVHTVCMFSISLILGGPWTPNEDYVHITSIGTIQGHQINDYPRGPTIDYLP